MGYESIRDLHERLQSLVGDIDPESAKGKKRRRILEAATGLFVAQGYRKTNIDEIAKAAGIAKGTVYLYFTTKAEVLLAAVAYEKLRSLSLLEGVFEPGLSARERLRRWVMAALRMVATSPLLARLGEGPQDFRAALAELDPALVATANADHSAFLGNLLDETISPAAWSDAERKERITTIDALSYFAPMMRSDHVRQGMSIERFTEVLASMIVDGIRPPEPDRATEACVSGDRESAD